MRNSKFIGRERITNQEMDIRRRGREGYKSLSVKETLKRRRGERDLCQYGGWLSSLKGKEPGSPKFRTGAGQPAERTPSGRSCS